LFNSTFFAPSAVI